MLFFHQIDEPTGIGQSADGNDTDDVVIKSQGRFLDPFQSAHGFKAEKIILCRFIRLQVNEGTKDRFHQSAAVAKEFPAAGRFAKDRIAGSIFKIVKVDFLFFNPPGQLPRRNTVIRIAHVRLLPITAGSILFRSGYFRLLCRTWRHRDND